MELSGQEILDYLEYSYGRWFNTVENGEDHLLMFETDENGKLIHSERSNAPMLKNRYYNFDSAEGINYKVDISKSEGERIIIESFADGKPFVVSKKYKVAINSYRGNGGGGHLIKGAKIPKMELINRIIDSTEKDLRYYIMKWIKEKGTVDPTETVNWSLIPKEIAEKAIEKDYKLMFNN